MDNEAAIKMTKTQTFHRRTRHIEHRHHFIRELVDRTLILVKGIRGKENPADPLTKLSTPDDELEEMDEGDIQQLIDEWLNEEVLF